VKPQHFASFPTSFNAHAAKSGLSRDRVSCAQRGVTAVTFHGVVERRAPAFPVEEFA
jgi:hypothetical protein